uniref:Uncharacterized protein n=2 Tax=Timema TaxID=61471 RepID=A0A7R9FZB2_TIMSH|nr:unnamed protein product [Timema shepardi]CAD7575922.1 unnamed protein product [Timema californicum]
MTGLGLYKSSSLQSVHHHNMKCVLSLCVLAVFLGLAQSEEKYTTKYDGVNLGEILKNERLRKVYVKCLMDDGLENCTPDGKELKENISDALLNECAKCSEKQKEGTKEVIRFLYREKPEEWKPLQAKYDPGNTYVTKYAKQLEEV